MSRKAQVAFDKCPNRSMRDSDSSTMVICPKYPEGTAFIESHRFEYGAIRGQKALKIGCLGCRYSSEEYDAIRGREIMQDMHPLIIEKCAKLFVDGHYTEATTKGTLVVRDRVIELTGSDRGAGAKGMGLHIDGSPAKNVDENFQEAIHHLLISNDKFRNTGTHTSCETVSDSQLAHEYLSMCSFLMHHLDSAEIKD